MLGSRVRAPGGARKEFRNELLFLLSAHSEHLNLPQCIEKFMSMVPRFCVHYLFIMYAFCDFMDITNKPLGFMPPNYIHIHRKFDNKHISHINFNSAYALKDSTAKSSASPAALTSSTQSEGIFCG